MSDSPTCQDCIDLLLDYVDGALSTDLKARLESHFQGCSPCEDFLATYRATTAVCQKVMAKQMPESVARKLKDFLRAEIGKDDTAAR